MKLTRTSFSFLFFVFQLDCVTRFDKNFKVFVNFLRVYQVFKNLLLGKFSYIGMILKKLAI